MRRHRAKRRLFQLAAALSLLLSLACFTLQHRRTDFELMRRRGPGPTVIALDQGKLFMSWDPRLPYRPQWAGQTNHYGFRYNVYSNGSWYVEGPLWMPGVLLAAAAALFAAPALWTRRPKPGLCPTCGYDLRASPDRCPECGQLVSPDTTQARAI